MGTMILRTMIMKDLLVMKTIRIEDVVKLKWVELLKKLFLSR
jgi:hypothetical protein